MDDGNTRALIWRHIREIGTCMLVTRSSNGMSARPMRGIADEEGNVIWFFTDRHSEQATDAESVREACLTFAGSRDHSFVSLTGEIDLVDDRAKIKALWTEGVDIYFPKGPDDPSVVLLRLTPSHGEYWDAPSNPVVIAIKFLQAKLSGERPVLGNNESTWMG